MTYDLVIRGGTVVDGSGLPGYRADVGVTSGRIARIGRTLRDRGRDEIDARGAVVAPGFIDGHTHMDAQVAWDPLGTCSCWHGVTTVVMGNCGFTLAPCRPDERHLVVRNLERAEDIPAEAMKAGIDWSWETYAQYLEALERWPKGINYAGYIGHSALRTYAMGERAFSEPATAADLAAMKRELADALAAGAIGFTTSRTRNHETSDRQPVASRVATWDEVRELVGVLGDLGAGIFEIAGEDTGRDPDRARDYLGRLRDLAVETGVPVTWGMFSSRSAPDFWRPYFDLLDETARAAPRRAAARPARSGAAAEARGLGRRRRVLARSGRRHQAAGLRLDLPDGRPHRSPPLGGGAGARARPRSRGDHDRVGPRAESARVLRAAAGQREPRPRARDDAASAVRGDLFGLRRARVADHGLVAPDPRARLLGATASGSEPRGGRAHAHPRAGHRVGAPRSGPSPRRAGRRHHRVRSGPGRAPDARGGERSSRRCAPAQAEGRGVSDVHRQRAGHAPQRRA